MAASRSVELLSRYVRTAASCAALFTFGPLRAAGRERIGELSRFFGHLDLPEPELPVVSLDAITDPAAPVVLRETDGVRGNVSLFELFSLARLVRTKSPRTIFEIGTFDGRTTLNLASNAPEDAAVFTLDLPPAMENATAFTLRDEERQYVRKAAPGTRVHTSAVAHRVTQLLGDSATFDFTPYAATGVDFVFVDGSHAYDYARSDSLAALSMLRHGHGTIVWHDYNAWRGVSEALHELRRENERFSGLRWIAGTTLAVLEV